MPKTVKANSTIWYSCRKSQKEERGHNKVLEVLVKAIPCIGKDLGMCTVAYASLAMELQQDGYTSKTRESQIFVGNQAD